MSVTRLTFESLDVGSSYFNSHAVYLHALRVRFVHEGHWVKVKITEAKKVENSYSHNVKFPLAINPVLSNRAVMFACSMRFTGRAVDRLVWPPSLSCDRKWPRVTKCTIRRWSHLKLKGNLVFLVWLLSLIPSKVLFFPRLSVFCLGFFASSFVQTQLLASPHLSHDKL